MSTQFWRYYFTYYFYDENVRGGESIDWDALGDHACDQIERDVAASLVNEEREREVDMWQKTVLPLDIFQQIKKARCPWTATRWETLGGRRGGRQAPASRLAGV